MSEVCVVTGANAGIGLAASHQLVERGATVVMVARSRERLETAQRLVGGDSHSLVCDLGDLTAVRRLAQEITTRFHKVDVLINNAAIFDLTVKEPMFSSQGHEQIWAVNHLGPFLLTQLLLSHLRDSEGRVVTISSQGLQAKPGLELDFGDLDSRRDFATTKAYYRSKLAQCMFAQSLHARENSVSSNAVRVTNVAVPDDRLPDLNAFTLWVYKQKRRLALLPQEMAETYVWLALDADLKGAYVDHHHKTVPWPKKSRDQAARERLWSISVDQVGQVA